LKRQFDAVKRQFGAVKYSPEELKYSKMSHCKEIILTQRAQSISFAPFALKKPTLSAKIRLIRVIEDMPETPISRYHNR
jgi:hypothetical protein